MTPQGGLGRASLQAFVPSSDLTRSRTFYEDVLGLRVTSHDGFAVELDAAGTAVRVTAVGTFEPHPFTVLGWDVDDVRASCGDLVSRGVEPVRFDGMDQDAHGVWSAPSGTAVAWFRDPDGNVLSISQRPAATDG